MVQEGIVLGHRISNKDIEVDIAKIEVIENLPPPTPVKGIQSFLGHAGFYRRFIKDFSKIFKPLCSLLEQNRAFEFTNECQEAFTTLKKALVSAPIIVAPDWSLPFELMCDARKELLVVLFAFDKFRAYLIGTKAVVYRDHSTIKKGTENQVVDHLSRLEDDKEDNFDQPIKETLPNEQL
ncbi:uncharacterized mitochondrial protein AtMg00860-like [Humulus lupulus]|uniref:uncharacterized mitochondrial protein AtMg00860-like n=1 Tax=Humulus lupulus TaxID=3486 RepID=UPI002B408C2E|nr:uncharacterized mitochondrial protein AtMg00860-like [Humulus lupulus]